MIKSSLNKKRHYRIYLKTWALDPILKYCGSNRMQSLLVWRCWVVKPLTHHVLYPTFLFLSLYRYMDALGSSILMTKHRSPKAGWWSWSGPRWAHGVDCQCCLKVTQRLFPGAENTCAPPALHLAWQMRWFVGFCRLYRFSTTGLIWSGLYL